MRIIEKKDFGCNLVGEEAHVPAGILSGREKVGGEEL
jgi:hypothetical protein